MEKIGCSPVHGKIAEKYEASEAGRHGEGRADVTWALEELLDACGCAEGAAREMAERALRAAAGAGVLHLVPIHRREPGTIARVRFSPASEREFFDYIGRKSPTMRREEWAEFFQEAAGWEVPERFAEAWAGFCKARASAALVWRGMRPFDLGDLADGREMLGIISRLLAWEGRHLVRWASSLVCGNSKTLERRQRTYEGLLAEATGGLAPTYESLGILPVPTGVTFHGPVELMVGGEWRDFRGLHGPTTLSEADVARVTACRCGAKRCLTVENATPFRSLAALRSGELVIHTSYPNSATLGLLRALGGLESPPEFWHFGDSDPSGFHILADLRERTGLEVRAFHMDFRPCPHAPRLTSREVALVEDLIGRMPGESAALEALLSANNKGDFEQESLKPPARSVWPFYDG